MRVFASGKFFALGHDPYLFRGVAYPPARCASSATEAGLQHMIDDFAAIRASGFTVVSAPFLRPPVIEAAVQSSLHFLLEQYEPSRITLVGESLRELRQSVRAQAASLRRAVKEWQGSDALIGVNLRFLPSARHRSHRERRVVQRVVNELALAVREEDATLLVGWREGDPSEADCPEEADFLTLEVDAADRQGMGAALSACHVQIGDRPLVADLARALMLPGRRSLDYAWMIDAALEHGAGGTIADAASVAANPHAASVNRHTVRDLRFEWPALSVVICAYNAEATLEECLSHCEALDYPRFEIVVVDDGSTDATARIAQSHPRARLVTIPRSGLSVARNIGCRVARGELIAYLDADAYPSPDWPWYIAIAALGERAGGSGGPNLPPADDPVSARVVARSPGGPVPQLIAPDRAAHVPGCNMAFWKRIIEQLDGFDPVFQANADDLEFQWRLAEAGYAIGYHPAALVWHHRRPGLTPYLRQQRSYGRGQAIVERRCPQRFPAGFRLRKAVRRLNLRTSEQQRRPIYPVRYLALDRSDGALLELAHQWGIPVALVAALTGPVGLVRRRLVAPALAASAYCAILFAIDFLRAGEGRRRAERTLPIRATVAFCRLLRPLAFRWGHLTGWFELRRGVIDWPPAPVASGGDGSHARHQEPEPS